ncbi:aspartate kinase [Phosphitispora sp. TUW77]|uniref:aspartate kinase n=1 Tax=Phosphitispora sp. TUW77 TaxID=3152361 RepID=UPI003AB6FCFA
MKIVVQKFGGTSVATAESREKALKRIIESKSQGYSPVVVVSAMGRKGEPYATDTLIDLVKSIHSNVEPRELDLLISCGEVISSVIMATLLKNMGHQAIALTGGQAGICTDGTYGNAQIIDIDPGFIRGCLAEGYIVVVAGFQGICSDGSTTTLGRGGSDTTATALGAALEAEYVEIYTDVDGVMTTDPRVIPDAAIMKDVSYREICEMAHHGAKVIHPRAVEAAMSGKVPIKIKNTFSDAEGTLIAENIDERVITGLAHQTNISQVKVGPLDGKAVQMAKVKVLKTMAEAGISIDMIGVAPNSIFFVINGDNTKGASQVLQEAGYNFLVDTGCAKISVIGAGMVGVPGVMAKAMESLDRAGVTVLQTSDSDITISFLIKEQDVSRGMQILYERFDLGKR